MDVLWSLETDLLSIIISLLNLLHKILIRIQVARKQMYKMDHKTVWKTNKAI